jgi:transcriptional regulator with XRE-family HTH domain
MPRGTGHRRGSSAYNPIDVHVGERLRTRRTLLGLSQMSLAEATGYSFQQLQKYEKGANRISASRLYDLSQILGVDIGYFFEGMDQATKKASPARLSRTKQQPPPPSGDTDPMNKRETLELVRAYYSISEPAIRDHLRKIVQSVARPE